MMKKISHTDIFLISFVVITWGYSWVLMKEALLYMEPLIFVGLRCLIGALALLLTALLRNCLYIKRERLREFFMVGIFQTAAMFALLIYGMKYVTAGKSAVFLYTMPVWTSFLVHFYLKERLPTSKWMGVFMGFTGILFIMGFDTLSKQNIKIILGESLIIGGAISWAIANILMKNRFKGKDPLVVTGFQLLFGATILILLSLLTEDISSIRITPYSIYILVFTGIVASAINFSIWFYLIKKIDINTLTFSSMLVPVFGLLFDRILLKTPLDPGVIVGGILILSGIYKISKVEE